MRDGYDQPNDPRDSARTVDPADVKAAGTLISAVLLLLGAGGIYVGIAEEEVPKLAEAVVTVGTALGALYGALRAFYSGTALPRPPGTVTPTRELEGLWRDAQETRQRRAVGTRQPHPSEPSPPLMSEQDHELPIGSVVEYAEDGTRTVISRGGIREEEWLPPRSLGKGALLMFLLFPSVGCAYQMDRVGPAGIERVSFAFGTDVQGGITCDDGQGGTLTMNNASQGSAASFEALLARLERGEVREVKPMGRASSPCTPFGPSTMPEKLVASEPPRPNLADAPKAGEGFDPEP